MKHLVTSLAVAAALLAAPLPAPAQEGNATLADIRQEMAVLYVELQKLKRELSTTGAPNTSFGADSTLQRVDLIERELTRLTSKTEELENRINQIVSDGTNQLDDLNFRLCELEPGCDIANLPPLQPIGGVAPPTATPTPLPQQQDNGPQLAMSEQADFDAAKAAFDAGDYAGAAQKFEAFTTTYPGGPLTGEAHFWRGEALAQQGETSAAARAYFNAFSGAPDGSKAPDALLRLGTSLAALGQQSEACVTLGEVSNRFPGSPAAGTAESERNRLGCS